MLCFHSCSAITLILTILRQEANTLLLIDHMLEVIASLIPFERIRIIVEFQVGRQVKVRSYIHACRSRTADTAATLAREKLDKCI